MKTIYLSGEFGWQITADKVREQIDPNSKEKLRVIVNSIGGYVDEGFEIYNILNSYKGEVEIIIGVMAASIASYVAMAAPLENRKGFKNSSFMVHEASRAAYGRARDFLTIAERLEGLNNIVAGAYAEGLGIGKEEAREMMNDDKYFTGWEALVEANIISDVVDLKDIDIPQKEEDEEAFIFFDLFMKEIENEVDIKAYKEKMYQIEDKINADTKKAQEDVTRAAARLNIESETGKKPVDDKSNLTTEETMNLQEFLNANPEAKAEYDNNLRSAEEKGKGAAMSEAAKADLTAERMRIKNILTVTGGMMTDTAAKAITEGMTGEQFAFSEITREKNNAEKPENKVDFGGLAVKQTPGEQDPTGKEEQKGKGGKDFSQYDEKTDELAKAYFGKEV